MTSPILPSSSLSSSSPPLAGVRVFLHLRNAPSGGTRSSSSSSSSSSNATVRTVLKTLRAQVQQLGAQLTLSDAAADLVVFHYGSAAVLTALHEEGVAVVRPDYLAACLAAEQRLSVDAFAIPRGDVGGGDAVVAPPSPAGKRPTTLSRVSGVTPLKESAVVAAVSTRSPQRLLVVSGDDAERRTAFARDESDVQRTHGNKPTSPLKAVYTPDTLTPKLTPSSRRDAPSTLSSLAATQELAPTTAPIAPLHHGTVTSASAARLGRGEGEEEEEERIRHAVLCSTAAEGTTRRRGRSTRKVTTAAAAGVQPSTPAECTDSVAAVHQARRTRGAATTSRAVDPFLSNDSIAAAPPPLTTQQQQTSALSLTVPLSDFGSAPITQPLPSPEAPTPAPASVRQQKRPRSSAARVRTAPADASIKQTAKRSREGDRVVLQEGRPTPSTLPPPTRSRRAQRHVTTVHDIDAPEAPLSLRFSDPSLLNRLSESEAAAVCVRFFVEEADGVETFLRDVVAQLGARIADDAAEGGGNHVAQKKATHLVASTHALLTPELLYHKARGIPIVTPQWVYDAVSLGGLPVVVPCLHAHPTFGDKALTVAAAALDEEGVVLGKVGTGAAPLLARPPLPQPAPLQFPRTPSMSAQLRELRKEVADEYVPAGEQARRPHYQPILRDCMVYLHVPPVDLAAVRTPAPRRTAHNTLGASHRTYFGDVVVALEQATQLIRLLGGTVTRNLGSTFLDLVVDLTGFYEQTIEAGQQQQHQLQRALGESLSCAYHDALLHFSSQHVAGCADATEAKSPTHLNGGVVPPIVGISWLVYSIVQRQRADVTPFILPHHPLSDQLTALRVREVYATTSTAASALAHVRVPTPTLTGSSLSLSSSSSSSVASAGEASASSPPSPPPPRLSPLWTPSTPPPCPTAADAAIAGAAAAASASLSPSSPSPWPAVDVSWSAQQQQQQQQQRWRHAKCVRGPLTAQKDSMQQLDTQEVAALLRASSASQREGSGTVSPHRAEDEAEGITHRHTMASFHGSTDVIGL